MQKIRFAGRPIRPVVLALVLAVSLGPWLGARQASARADKTETPKLEQFYKQWLDGVAPLISPAERRLYEEMVTDRERDLFIHAFWRARDPEPAGADSVAGTWHRRFVEARRRFGSLEGDRARALVLAGVPASIQIFGGCRGVLRPLRVWRYDRYQRAALGLPGETGDGGFDLVFRRHYDAADGLFAAWSPAAGLGELSEDDAPWQRRNLEQILAFSRERSCFRTGAEEEATLATALRGATDLERLIAFGKSSLPPADWVEPFRHQLEAGELKLPADPLEPAVAIGFPGRDASKILVLGRLKVPVESLRRGAAGQLFDRLVLLGEARLGSWVANRFEQIYHLMGPPPTTDYLELDFYRRLRPGTYELRLRLEDAYGRAVLRQDLRVVVPVLGDAPRLGDDQKPVGSTVSLRELTRKQVVSMVTFPGLEILPLADNPVGEVEVRLVTSGGGVERVEVQVDDKAPSSDQSPPFAVLVDLGQEPAKHQLRAIAYDAAGRAVARAGLAIEPERPLAVTLRRHGDQLRAHLHLPQDETLEAVQLYLDDSLLAHLEAPPFVARLPSPLPAGSRFARAVATTASGARTEDLIFFDQAIPNERVNVRWVEVYATVLGDAGRPVTGLSADDFRVLEEGAEQPLERFDVVDNLPIQVVLAMDTSVSMRDRLETSVASARRFFSTVLRDKDRAALVTFNHDLTLAVPFTGEIDRLHLGASGLDAWGGTRLYDAVVFAGGYVGGHRGRRALVLLTDGRDVESDFGAAGARENALRAGVAVYPILLGVRDPQTRGELEALARASGGRAFSIRGVGQLDGVYGQIEEELRSQYLLVFQAPEDGEPGEFRRLEIETSRPGLRVRSLSGYYR